MGKLTANQVKNLVEAGTYEDGDGLRLLVKPSGRKTWVLRFQLNGKRREMGLGSYPQLDLKKARAAAYENKIQILNGTDPLAKRQAEQAAQREATRRELAQLITFEKLAADYRDAHGSSWSEKWRKGWLRKLELYAFPTIGKLSADQVDTKHLIKVLQPLWSTKTRTADEVRGQIEQILDAARAQGLRTGENPARWRGHLENLLSRHEKKKARKRVHHPALRWQDLPELMRTLNNNPSHVSVATQLLILTGARSHMIRLARWDELDLEAGRWSLPAERMKTREPFAIPLAPEAVSLLKNLSKFGTESPYVFPGRGRSGVMHANGIRNLLHELGYEHITRHGFRSTFRDWAGEKTHFPREICELALAHDERGETESAYSRSDFFDKRRELMDAWAVYASSAPVRPPQTEKADNNS
ncbi:integrase arm-type DNA-binding domain-containing protein [Pseudomonas sp. SWRI79]|jgi:integrase|uniref:Integrase arm-type DNA-binding domain-containing protein n=1 Tax=Pseudomonas farris TaxID=2841207 RepID=A0ABS6Q249_9PSED|nr:integrase arm-type DNA-binding domain-containing protein [Pseudomonas farris]MBV4466361.1 integrase arm-type DNA-binding domain-containing protein [Pseudomonas farris]